MGADFFIEEIFTRPEDAGYFAVSRERTYYLLLHKKKAKFLQRPADIYKRMAARLSSNKNVQIGCLYWENDETELRREAMSCVTAARMPDADDQQLHDWTAYLTPFEKNNLEIYNGLWKEKHESFKDAVYVLHQNPEKRPSHSSQNGDEPARLPTVQLAAHLSNLYIYIGLVCHLAVAVCIYIYYFLPIPTYCG